MPYTSIASSDIIEITCVLGKKIRTTQAYWHYISEIKHADLASRFEDVIETVRRADEVWCDTGAGDIYVYYRHLNKHWACVVVRHLNGDGFIVTAYLTSKSKRKGVKIWPSKKNNQ
jgi:hypothetical protein